jgi:hypothetical protein
MQQGRSTIASSLLGLIVVGALVYGVIAALDPWAFHMGGRWTPFLTWHGSGKLVTKSGEYPLFVSFYPSSHFSRLHMDGVRPAGGIQGYGYLCTSRGVTQRLELGGTIYGAWRTTDGDLMAVRLLEPRIFDVGQRRGFFDLMGRWNGPELTMDSRTTVPEQFRSGLKIEHASVTLTWDTYSDFKAACENGSR